MQSDTAADRPASRNPLSSCDRGVIAQEEAASSRRTVTDLVTQTTLAGGDPQALVRPLRDQIAHQLVPMAVPVPVSVAAADQLRKMLFGSI